MPNEMPPIAAGRRHSVACREDGTVVAVGSDASGECRVRQWDNVVAVVAGNVHTARNTGRSHTVGLRSDGTVLANTAVVPTAAMVTNQVEVPRSVSNLRNAIDDATRTEDNLYLDALALAHELFDDHMPANMILVGAAYQRGLLPLTGGSIEQAIRLNGAAVDKTLLAFQWGRATVSSPDRVHSGPTETTTVEPIDSKIAAYAREAALPPSAFDLVIRRGTDLVGYQSLRYAMGYVRDVSKMSRSAPAAIPADVVSDLTVAYAFGLYKLMAYKDEYEVARLHLDRHEKTRIANEFGADAEVAVLLHPPLLRAAGMKRKIKLKRSATPAFRALRSARVLRGTPLDIFGYANVRRVERELVGWYSALVQHAMAGLSVDTIKVVTEIIELPTSVRGYEQIKLDSIDRARSRADELLKRLGSASTVAN